jgi:uncharacterized protein (TIGR03382 family)
LYRRRDALFWPWFIRRLRRFSQIDEAVRFGNGPAITLAALLTGLLALLGRRRFRQRERATGTRAEQVGRNLWKSA